MDFSDWIDVFNFGMDRVQVLEMKRTSGLHRDWDPESGAPYIYYILRIVCYAPILDYQCTSPFLDFVEDGSRGSAGVTARANSDCPPSKSGGGAQPFCLPARQSAGQVCSRAGIRSLAGFDPTLPLTVHVLILPLA